MPGKASSRRRVVAVPIQGASSRLEAVLVTAAFVVLAAGLVAVSFVGMPYMLGAIGVAAYLLLLALLGSERMAILTLVGAFATAPMYKGLAPSVESPVTPTDLLFVLGFATLLPSIFTRRIRLPMTYLVGLGLVVLAGCVSSALSEQSLQSFTALVLWMMVMGALPVAFALWRPSSRIIELLAWAYVVGHHVSIAFAFVYGASTQDRYAGLATHPNYFAQASMMSVALLLYLFYRYKTLWPRVVVLAAAASCCGAILMSGSRAATVVVAVLFLMIPIVERSAITGFVYALLAALAAFALPLAVGLAGEGSSLTRLSGNLNSTYSDRAREAGIEDGFERFWAHPFTGDGLIELFEIHNNFLEVAVAVGIFGLVGYLLIMFTFAVPLFGVSEHRRLCYTVWAYLGFGATIPSLYDRSIWGPVALSIVAVIAAWTPGGDEDDGALSSAPLVATPGGR